MTIQVLKGGRAFPVAALAKQRGPYAARRHVGQGLTRWPTGTDFDRRSAAVRGSAEPRMSLSWRRLRCEEFDKMVVDLVRRFLLQVVAGRKRLRVDEVAGVFAPHCGEFLGRRLSPRSPQ